MARGWSTPQSRPRVAVPTGLFLDNRHTRGSRLESVFCCFDVRSPAYSLLPNAAHDPQMDPPAAGSFVVVDAVVGDFSFDICSASTSCAIASS